MPRWINRPDGSNWGDFGPDDQIGRMNWLTPERRLAGVREVREGIAFSLSLPLDYPGGQMVPFRAPPRLFGARDEMLMIEPRPWATMRRAAAAEPK